MELGLVGLGKMGGNMRQRIRNAGHTVVGFDHNQDISDSKDLADMVGKLTATDQPKVVWVMVPVQAIDPVVTELAELLSPGDIVIDGGNSRWTDDTRRAAQLAEKDIRFVDCGVSGGVWGLENGYALMCGGDTDTVATVMPIFEALKPEGEFGFVHAGKVGAGHFTKMVHNGIEYGLMQAYAEGFSILQHKSEFNLDLHQIAEIWRHGSVVRSWLLDLTSDALQKNPTMHGIAPYVADSGEGRWTVAEAIELGVPAPVITLSLLARLRSRDTESFTDKLLSAMRNQFGGHAIKKE
jgi:6-phosphogluconate dehydrogenase